MKKEERWGSADVEVRDRSLELDHITHPKRSRWVVQPATFGHDEADCAFRREPISGHDMAGGANARNSDRVSEAPSDVIGIMNVKVEECAPRAAFITVEVAPIRHRAGAGEHRAQRRARVTRANQRAKPRPAGPEAHAETR